MYRQSPSRNPRSRGIKIKHVLQICLLLAVCFWLIYQVKHSHDKKKEFDESDTKASLIGTSDEFIKLGRKDIQTKNEKHEEPIEEEETGGEDEDIKEVEENKHEDDESEPGKSDAEVDREEDMADDDEKEREDVDETETQETDSEDDGGHNGQIDKENSEEDKSVHEAREENYKADDASSAVTHDTQTSTNEKENVTASGIKEDSLENPENGSPPNNTVAEEYNGHLTSNSSSTEVIIENHDSSLQNVTESKPELDHDEGTITEGKSGNSTINVDNNGGIDSNSTGSPETKDANIESFESEKITGNNTESSKEKNEEIEAENSEIDENMETTTTENPEEVEHDSIDISDNTRVDLDTLPEIQTEGTNSDDTAEE